MSYSKLYSYDDFLSFLSESGYGDVAKKKKNAIDESLKEQLKSLEAQKKSINDDSDELARQAYLSYISSSKDIPDKLAATGLNGGAADNLYLSLVNEYQNNYNEIGKERKNKLYDTDTEMIKAKLSSSAEYSNALSDIYDSAVEKFLGIRENEEKRNFESYYNDKELSDKAADRKAQSDKDKADRELEKAKLALQAGDFSVLEDLGIKPSVGNSSSSSSSGSGGTGGSSGNMSELLKQLDYAVSLAKYGNYTLLCSITGMTEEEAALKFADGTDSGYTESQIRDAAKLFMGGDFSKNVLGILKSAYPEYTYEQIWKIWKSVAENEWLMYVNDSYKGPRN